MKLIFYIYFKETKKVHKTRNKIVQINEATDMNPDLE